MSILVATDLSDRSRSALQRAATEAERRNTGLVVLHCVATPQEKWEYLEETPPDMADRVETAARRHLDTFVEETLDTNQQARVDETRIEIGHAVEGIVDADADPDVELVVLGATGAGRLTQFLLGSTAEEVVRAAESPVLVVPAEQTREEVDTILAPVDLSECSRASLQYAVDWARREDAKVLVMHATTLPTGAMELMDRKPTEEDTQSHREFTSEQMDAFLSKVDVRDVEHEELLRFGAPHREIDHVLEDYDADLVVMGTHGRRGFERLFLGSTAAKVLRRLSIPAVTVRHRGEDDEG
jgi:nucleotide-binding universal stress UspA family protein